MATVEEMIGFAKSKTEEMRAKMLEVDVLLHDFQNPGPAKRDWITVTVDAPGALVDYLALLAEAEVILGEFPKSPSDVPVGP